MDHVSRVNKVVDKIVPLCFFSLCHTFIFLMCSICYNKEKWELLMTIEEAIEWIHSRLPFGSRPGLDRVEALLEVVGHPERKVKRSISLEQTEKVLL